MMGETFYCFNEGHRDIKITHVCFFKGCRSFCCRQCINDKLHNHGRAVLYHIIPLHKIFQEVPEQLEYYNYSNGKYKFKQIDQTQFNKAQISNSERFLAYGGKDKILKIYEIMEGKIVKQIKCDSSICALQFTDESSKLYVGIENSKIQCFDMQRNFKIILEFNIKYKNLKKQEQFKINIQFFKVITTIQQQKLILKERKEYSKFKIIQLQWIIISRMILQSMHVIKIIIGQQSQIVVIEDSSLKIKMPLVLGFYKYNSLIIAIYQFLTAHLFYINGIQIILIRTLQNYKN